MVRTRGAIAAALAPWRWDGVVAALPLCALLFVTRTPATGKPLHHWTFDSDGLVVDEGVGDAANGTLTGGATVSGGTLRLDGTSGYVQFGALLVPTSPEYTVALFARATSAAAGRDFISQGSAGAAFQLGVSANGTALRAGDNWPEVAGTSFAADGQFHHYALVMSASGAMLYVDGTLAATDAPFAGGAGGTATRLGRGVGAQGAFFGGELDDVRIYASALTDEEVKELARGERGAVRFRHIASQDRPARSTLSSLNVLSRIDLRAR